MAVMEGTAWRWTALVAWMVVYLSDASAVGAAIDGTALQSKAAKTKGAQEEAAPALDKRSEVEKVVKIGYFAGYQEGVKRGGSSSPTKSSRKCSARMKKAKKWAKRCEEKKRRCCQGRKKCWGKMTAGMAKRKAARQKRKVRIAKVMEKRKLARDKRRNASRKQREVIKAMKAQLKVYKAIVKGMKGKGGGTELAEANDGSRGGSSAWKAAQKMAAASKKPRADLLKCLAASKDAAAQKKATTTKKPRGDLLKCLAAQMEKAKADHEAALAKAEALLAKAKKSAKKAKQSADNAQKAQDAAEKKSAAADEKEAEEEEKAEGTPTGFAFDSRHGVEKPESDGKPKRGKNQIETSNVNKMCATQISVKVGKSKQYPDGWRKDESTCTSCKPGYAFKVQYHKSKAGKCEAYGPEAIAHCTDLDRDTHTADLASKKTKNLICTNIIAVRENFPTWKLKGKAKKFFKSVSNGKIAGTAFVHCNVWKQTMCTGGVCYDKKEVKCDRVCKANTWSHGWDDGCSKALCEFTPSLCKQTAMLN